MAKRRRKPKPSNPIQPSPQSDASREGQSAAKPPTEVTSHSEKPATAADTPAKSAPADPLPKPGLASRPSVDATRTSTPQTPAKAAAPPPRPRPIRPETTESLIQASKPPAPAAEPTEAAAKPASTPSSGTTKPGVSGKKLSEEAFLKETPLEPEFPTGPERAPESVQEPKPEDIGEPPAPSGPQIPSMFVVMITPELAPVAKVGGLADVVFGLGRELEMRGNAVEIILPKYDCMRYDHIWGLTKTFEDLWVPWFGGAIHCSVWFGFVHGRKCFFIEPHSNDNFFNRGIIYGHNDDVMRFAFFCRAAMEFMHKTGKHPDIIHCHDWQTALAPVLLYEMYQQLGMTHPRVCFTVHNFRHQGVTGQQVLQATGLNRPEYFFHYDRLRDNANPYALNLMKGGIVYSNFVTTVSPRHAWEAKDGGQGHGLEHTLWVHQGKYGGVLNGLDYEMFNPETDTHIATGFGVDHIEKKYENKRALRQRFWLADNEKPIVAFVGRLDPQKGLDLVRHAIFHALNNGAQFVLLGSAPDKATNDHFLGLKHHLNDSPDCHLEIGYNLELAHQIYAGSDMMIVPSRYEPCGLTQLISMRYGTVPIVRAVGGLADTVFDKDFSHLPLHQRNGYVFTHADNAGLESALQRAIACYYQFPDHFRHLMLNGMNTDYSWKHPGQHYLNIYDYIRAK